MLPDRPDFLNVDLASIKAFCSTHSHLASQAQDLLWLEWVLFSLIYHCHPSFTSSTIPCVQQVTEYHREAALLCMRGRANIGLALTRMACELSRDVLRLARDPDAECVWSSRKSDSKQFRRMFKFNLDDHAEKILFEIYKISSICGVHGHVLITDPVTQAPSNREDDRLLRLRPRPEFVVQCLSLNLASIQAFIMAFLLEHGQPFVDAQDPALTRDAKQLAHDVSRFDVRWRFEDQVH